MPLADVGSRKFEEVCRDLVTLVFPELVVRASMKRTSGARQFGVDVEGFDEDGEPAVVISAKCYQRIRAGYFRPWLDEFVRHLDGHWAGRRIRYFILAISHEANDDAMNEAARDLSRELGRRDIKFRLWNAEEISRHLRGNPDLVDRYFHAHWRDAISALPGTATPAAPAPTALTPPARAGSIGLAHRMLAEFEDRVNERVDTASTLTLDAVLEDVARGRPGALRRWYDDARRDEDFWDRLSPPIRARACRANAMILLGDRDLDGAERLLDEADAVSPAGGVAPRALFLHASGAHDEALNLLDGNAGSKVREVRAAILIEVGRIPEAATILGEAVGDAVTAEILRLRSIVALLQGRLDDAVADARSSVERAPDGLAELLGLAAARFYRALAAGVSPMIGGPPEPLHPGLIRDGAAARDDLSASAADFERALRLAEEGLRPAIEVWRLAATLMNPGRSDEAASIAAALLDRPLPDPLVVAWAMAFGRLDNTEPVRKSYAAALRDGTATPSHLVVLALLVAGNDKPYRGRALLRRYADRFPDAADFLAGWRARFGDATVQGDVVDRAWDLARRRGDHVPLLDIARAIDADPSTVLSVAEYLVWKEAWSDLDALRAPLTTVGTRRSVELAALGALRAGDPTGCLGILATGAASLAGGRLPAPLLHLRIGANEALGRHRSVIDDLLDLRRDGGDPFAHARVMEALVRIGDLEGLRREADMALERGDLDPRNALSVAYALRAVAPTTARRALTLAAATPPSNESVGAVAALAAELGLTELHERLFAVLLSEPEAGRHVLRISEVEEAVALFQQAADDHRVAFQDWHGGRSPFALATARDPATYGRMFLADSRMRRDRLGEAFPMLLLTGAVRDPVPTRVGDELRLDLSALLLAIRLDLLPDLERRLRLRVPLAAAEALIELEAAYRDPDPEIVAALRELLEGRGRFRIEEAPPERAVSADGDGPPGEVNAPVARALVERAFRAGHLDRDHADATLRALGAVGADACEIGDGVVLSRFSATRLAGAGVLSQLARVTQLYLTTEEAVRLRNDIDAAVEDGRLRACVSGLRNLLAGRLAEGRWTTFSRAPEENEARLPAHLRCLMESISIQEHEPGLLWVEDRALSRVRGQGFLALPDVVDIMRDRDAIDAGRAGRILRAARDAGYGWLPLDVGEFDAAIRAAPLEGDVLVETPALASLRAWMARDTILLRHIDTSGETAPDGRIVGEARRLLDVWGLARDLFARIWADTEGSDGPRRARSNWVWANLRIDRFEGLPADTTEESRRTFRAMHIANLLDLPLIEALGPSAKPVAAWQGYVSWLMSAWVTPQAEADPRLPLTAGSIVGAHLEALLDRPADLPEAQARDLRPAFARLVHDYLELLPEAWADAVADRPAIRERLGLHDAIILTFVAAGPEASPGLQATVTAVAAAYAGIRGRPGPGAGIAELRFLDGQVGSIEATVGENDRRGVTVILDERRYDVDGLTVALLEPDASFRSIPEEHRRPLLDPLGNITEADIVAVERIVDPEERFAALGRLLDLDLHRRLDGMGRAFRARGTLSLADLAPPSPEAIGAYLRVPVPQTISGFARVTCDALARGLSGDEVAVRLAGLPLELPNDFLQRRGATLADPDIEKATSAVNSPLIALLDLCALAAVGDRQRIDAAFDRLSSAIRSNAALWVSLLRYAAAAAARDDAWIRLDPAVRLAFLWSFAERCLQRLAAPGYDSRPVAEWVDARAAFPFTAHIGEDGSPDWYARQTIWASEARFVAQIAAHALRSGVGELASVDALARFATCLGRNDDAPWLPDLDIVGPPPVGPPEVWAAEDPLDASALGAWFGQGHPYSGRDDDSIAQALLTSVTALETRHLLPPLLSVVEVRRVSAETRRHMLDVLSAAAETEPFEPGDAAMVRVLAVEGIARAIQGDVAGMKASLARRSRRYGARWPAFGPFDAVAVQAAEQMCQASLRFALALPSALTDRFSVFADCAEAIVEAWPASVGTIRGCLDRLAYLIDAECGGRLWPAIVRLRQL